MKPGNTSMDCPLCGEVSVIYQTPFKIQMNVAAGTEEMDGNYEQEQVGGEIICSDHAKQCPKLVGVTHPEELLKYHLGDTRVLRSDSHSFENYMQEFHRMGFTIEANNIRENDKFGKKVWKVLMFIKAFDPTRGYTGVRYLRTLSDRPDQAFQYLKHRLLCGEILTTDSPEERSKNQRFQLQTNGTEISFKKLPKLNPE